MVGFRGPPAAPHRPIPANCRLLPHVRVPTRYCCAQWGQASIAAPAWLQRPAGCHMRVKPRASIRGPADGAGTLHPPRARFHRRFQEEGAVRCRRQGRVWDLCVQRTAHNGRGQGRAGAPCHSRPQYLGQLEHRLAAPSEVFFRNSQSLRCAFKVSQRPKDQGCPSPSSFLDYAGAVN